MIFRANLTVFFLFLVANLTIAGAVAGDPDRGFSGDGRLTVTLPSNSNVRSVAVQPDGKIIAVGASSLNFVVLRFNRDGSPDPTFDSDGVLFIDFGGGIDDAQVVNVLPDGKILVGGFATMSGTGQDFALARLNQNGSFDTTFDGDGRLTIDLGSTTGESLRGIHVQTDGKYLLAGRTAGTSDDFGAARIEPNGQLDPTFDGDGKVVIAVSSALDQMWDSALQPNGRLIIVGHTQGTTTTDFAAIRLTTTGQLDPNFDGDGIFTYDFASNSDFGRAVAIQPDGRIVFCGSASVGGNPDIGCIRLNANGTLNANGFGTNGRVTINFGTSGSDTATAVIVEPNGKIIAAGQTNEGGNTDFAVVRFNSDGTPDLTFSGDARLRLDFNGEADLGAALALTADGRLMVAGSSELSGSSRAALARFHLRAFNSPFDFDGDDRSDLGVFKPTAGEWWYQRSSDNAVAAAPFGTSTDRPVPADFTGDGKTDIAIWRPSNGFWFILRSEDSLFYGFPFGASGDVPVPGDYDADGRADAAVYRPSTATWFIQRSSDNSFAILTWGSNGDTPVPADYDGDGRTDVAIFRPSDGSWWISRSSDQQTRVYIFGVNSDRRAPADWTGDGKADLAFFRPSTGTWFVLRSEDDQFYAAPFGANGDICAAADFDGDQRFDSAVFRPSNQFWYVSRSAGGVTIAGFGSAGDVPVQTTLIP